MTGFFFRGGIEWTVTGRSLPPARFALALPEEVCLTIELDWSRRPPVYDVNSPTAFVDIASGTRPIPAISVNGASSRETLAG